MLRSALVSDSCVGITAYRSENRAAAAPRSEIALATAGGPEARTNGSRHALTRKSAVAPLGGGVQRFRARAPLEKHGETSDAAFLIEASSRCNAPPADSFPIATLWSGPTRWANTRMPS